MTMVKLIGGVTLAAVTAFSANALAQPFPTCTDANNYGIRSGELMVGQVFASLQCDSTRLPKARNALVTTTRGLVATWSGPDEHKLCYYGGLYDSMINRLQFEENRCRQEGFVFAPLSLNMVARLALAAFSAMTHAVPKSLTENHVRFVFSRDYTFLGPIDPQTCKFALKSAQRENLKPAELRRHRPLLDVIESALCFE